MQKLIAGIHHFQNNVFGSQRDLFERLAQGQKPEAMFITCSDSRIDPNLITSAQPGELFIVRNVGNIIPCHGTSNNGEMAAVEFAVLALGIKDIIVCGHTACGAMKGLLNLAALDNMPTVQNWLRHADSTNVIIRDHYGHLSGDALVTATAEENVLVQLDHLRTSPVIAARLSRGLINLHAWMYKIDTGAVFCYDFDSRQFIPFIAPGAGGNGQMAPQAVVASAPRIA